MVSPALPLNLAAHTRLLSIVPNASFAKSKGLRRPSEALVRKVRAGYAGGTTWVDEQIGKVLAALDATGRRDSTLVMHWADHGWALGEHSMYCKMANFDLQVTCCPAVYAARR